MRVKRRSTSSDIVTLTMTGAAHAIFRENVFHHFHLIKLKAYLISHQHMLSIY